MIHVDNGLYQILISIDKLENRNSFSHDGVSNKLLKLIKCEIIKFLTIIVN